MPAPLAIARKPVAAKAAPATVPATIQRKLEVGGAGDRFEREADQVARRAVQGGAPAAIPPTISPLGAQRKPMSTASRKEPEEKKPGKAQRKAAAKPPRAEEPDKASGKKAQRKAAAKTPKVEEDKKSSSKKAQRKPAATAKPKPEEDKKVGGAPRKAQRLAQRDDGGIGGAGGLAPSAVESSIGRMQSAGAGSLDSTTRSFMESRIGHDFGNVRIHHGSDAAAAADALNARAFTVGNDVFFNRGQYQPHSHTGRELLAHELTHTVQQAGRAARKVQRVPTPGAAPAAEDVTLAAGTELVSTRNRNRKILYQPGNGKKGIVTLPQLALPRVPHALKGATSTDPEAPQPAHANNGPLPQEGVAYDLTSQLSERENAVPTWLRYMRREEQQSGIRSKLAAMRAAKPNAAEVLADGQPVFYLKPRRGPTLPERILIGTATELAREESVLRPNWGPRGAEASFDVDHILELQIGGKDAGENMWLLDSSFNRSSGSTIHTDFQSALDDAVTDTSLINRLPRAERPASSADLRSNWNIRFNTVAPHARLVGSDRPAWTRTQIAAGTHLDQLQLMTENDLVTAGLRLREGQVMRSVVVFPTPRGGEMVRLPLDRAGTSVDMSRLPRNAAAGNAAFLYEGIEIISATFNRDQALQENGNMLDLRVRLFPPGRRGRDPPIDRVEGNVSVRRDPRLGVAGYLTRDSIRRQSTRFPGASPLEFPDLDISPAGKLAGEGEITATKALFPNLPIRLYLDGNDIGITAPITRDQLSLGPLTVTEASLGLGYGAAGLFVNGFAAFEVRGLGSGSIEGRVDEGNAYLAGSFNLTTDFLNPATVGVRYDIPDDRLTISGHFGLASNQIPGVAAADANLTISRDGATFAGTVTLAPPLAGIVINIGYDRETGLSIGADNIPLPFADLPAVENAVMSVNARRSPEGVWSFNGSGTATLAVPGATGTINLSYADGLVTMTAVAAVQKGPATGTLNFTATNGAIDEQGNPIEGQIGDGITAWGRGSASVQFGRILTGTAGIEYTPDNRIILRGSISMPPEYPVFDIMPYTKNLFRLPKLEFPVWGVSVAGIGVGIYAFVDAAVSFNASIGPGVIRNATLGAEMDIDRPEDATVCGGGEFYVPAYVGLSLDIGGGLGASAAVAYVEGRVGLTGELGIAADVSAAATIDWNRNRGVTLGGRVEANARPKFKLTANASVTVGVDLYFTDISHTFGPWNETLGEFGPDMELGVTFPVNWSETNGLELSLNDMEVRRPSLDPASLLSDVFDSIT